MFSTRFHGGVLAAMLITSFIATPLQAEAAVATTVPFRGRLLTSATTAAANQSFSIRFSIWADADFSAGSDVDGSGALVGSAWQEVTSITTDAQGFFTAEVGSVTTLPNFDFSTHRFLQAEVKATSAADTAYFVLDTLPTNASVDRKSLSATPYALNASRLEGKSLGFDAGEIPYLDEDGKFDRSLITDDSWLDPVADLTAMNAIASPAAGDVTFVFSEGRIYTYSGSAWAKTGGDLDSSVAALDTRLTTAESDIAQAIVDIASNLAAIAANDGDIATNISNISSNLAAIGSNDTDIATNVSNIASNLAAIQANDGDIATNIAAIASNLAAIQANDAEIAANVAAIAANDTDIAANLAAIGAETAARSAADAVLQADIDQNESDADAAIAAETAARSTAITAEAEARAAAIAALDADTYSQTEVDTLVSSAIQGLSWKSPVATVSALSTTYASPISGDTVYVTGTGEIYTYANSGDGWVKTGADFFQDASTTTAGIVRLAADGEIAAGKAVQSNDSRLAQVSTNTSNIATNAGLVSTLQADVDQNEADADAALAAEVVARNAAIAVETAARDAAVAALQADVDQNEADADTAIAANVTSINNMQNLFSAGFDVFILP